MATIEWTHRARADLRGLRAYIGQDSPFYARQFTERLAAAVERLADNPMIGRRVPEADREDVRELVYRGYRILYLTTAGGVRILAVVHGSRDLAGHGAGPWESE